VAGALRELRRGRARAVYDESVPRELVERWLSEWRTWFGAERVAPEALPRKLDVAVVDSPLGRLVAKRERRTPLRRARVLVHLRLARDLEQAGLRVAPALAALIEPRAACLVQRWQSGASPLDWLARGAGTADDPRGAALVAGLAELVARLHRADFRHRDLKELNLRAVQREGRAIEIVLLDLGGIGRARIGPLVAARDLGRLWASLLSAAGLRLGFTAAHARSLAARYLELRHEQPAGERELDRLCSRASRWAARHAAHNARRDRRTA
jgi:tRNA A-37 threonylcarbamoyl transferase component Bud32